MTAGATTPHEPAGDPFGVRRRLTVGDRSREIWALDALGTDVARLPYSVRLLLEAALRAGSPDDVDALVSWSPEGRRHELAFRPARVLLQDFTGVPAVVDLAAVRDAVAEAGGDPRAVVPRIPAELVVDHSVQVDAFGTPDAFRRNVELEYQRNAERYRLLRWGQQAFEGLRVVPPGTGIVHQVNLEHLARVVVDDGERAFPDTVVGTDSHTPMVNGLGVLGWGVGGIEAEAALLGQPVPVLTPQVVGMGLTGELPEGATATDLVLTVTERLRAHGVVGAFIEFHGQGVARIPVATRATIGNMSPEYGSTVTMFPIDDQTLRYLRFTGRDTDHVALVEAYAKEQGLFHDPAATPDYTATLTLDLGEVEPSIAGPSRPQDRTPLRTARAGFRRDLDRQAPTARRMEPPVGVEVDGQSFRLDHGDVVLAAITSCTNTSNPEVMLAAGLLARNAVERGLARRPWVKTSLAPGSQVVMDYLARAGVLPYLEKLGFDLVGFGCTTCIGNSGPLAPEISRAIRQHDLAAAAVLSGNRNFAGRIHPDVRLNYLASPPLVIAYALAGTMDLDLLEQPIGTGADGEAVHLSDIWPSDADISAAVEDAVRPEMFTERYADVFTGDQRWRTLAVPDGLRFDWDDTSTYVRRPTFLTDVPAQPEPVADILGARALAVLGDSVTTDHISPAGAIAPDSPAGRWLRDHGVAVRDFNSYGARRGNHEVMVRGTFANVRLRNHLVPDVEGGVTRHLPSGEQLSIYDAAVRYAAEGTPLIVLAGTEYGSGSSRDWAAKGTRMLGVRAVIAAGYERIHRSNLIGMGVLPLQYREGESATSLGLTGQESFDIRGLGAALDRDGLPGEIAVSADGTEFPVQVRLDSPTEVTYYRHGGILPYAIRTLTGS